ncbi:MAG: copper chaperone PCu(A)C [Pseudomonadales bacterium]
MRPDPGRLLAWLLLAALAACAPAEPLDVNDARIRELIPGQDKTVAYLTLHNRGDAPLALVGAETDLARAVEIHTTLRDGEVMRMRRLSRVEIPAGGTVRFEPGGHHLMLFGVRSLDDPCEIRLLFADGSTRSVTFDRIAIGGR